MRTVERTLSGGFLITSPGQLARHVEILALGRHAVDQVGLEGLLGGEEAAGERCLHR